MEIDYNIPFDILPYSSEDFEILSMILAEEIQDACRDLGVQPPGDLTIQFLIGDHPCANFTEFPGPTVTFYIPVEPLGLDLNLAEFVELARHETYHLFEFLTGQLRGDEDAAEYFARREECHTIAM